jgi:hypothetical protein
VQNLVQRRGLTYEYAANTSTPWELAKVLAAAANITQFALFDNSNHESVDVARMATTKYRSIMVAKCVRHLAEVKSVAISSFHCSQKPSL